MFSTEFVKLFLGYRAFFVAMVRDFELRPLTRP